MALAATHDINLLSQAENHSLKNDSKNSSGGVGVSFGTDGFGIYAEASMGMGKARGNGITHAETTINADNVLTMISGNDTTIQGAQLKGNQVIANIGNNLTIRSEQDTDDFSSKTMQAGAKVMFGLTQSGFVSASGYYSQGKVDSHYGMTQMTAAAQSVSSLLAAGASNAQIESQLALSAAARASYTDAALFALSGVIATTQVKSTSVYQQMLSILSANGLSQQAATTIADNLVLTGTKLPTAVTMNAGDELIKLVPKGTFGGDLVGPTSPFFVTRAEYERLSRLPTGEIASQLGIPAEQSIRGSQLGFDVYSMTPKAGVKPVVFESVVAPISQGAYRAPGGAQQTIVADRNLWTDPNALKIGELH